MSAMPPDDLRLPPLSLPLLLGLTLVAAFFAAITGARVPAVVPERPTWTIPPAQEGAILQWLGPLTDGAQLTPAWRIADVAIDREMLRLHVRDASSRPGPWVTLRLDGQPPQLVLDVPQDLPADLARTLRATAAGRPLPGPFVLSHPRTRPVLLVPWESLAWAYLTLRFFSLLAALLAAVWLVRSLPRQLWLPYAGLTLLAAGARFWLSPATFLHEFYHVRESLNLLVGQPGFFNGYGGPALYAALVPWWPADPAWMFTVNAIAATVTVPALGRLAALAWRDERAGLAAALLLALSPLHLRWGAAEDQWVLATAWTSLALAACLDAQARSDPLAPWLAAMAAALAMQSRPELIPLPLVLLLLALVYRPRWLSVWLRSTQAWLAIMLAAIALWPLALLWRTRPPAPLAALSSHIWHDAQWLNPQWTPLPLQVASAMALVLALRRRDWAVLLIAGTAVVWMALPGLFYGGSGPYLERTQLMSSALAIAVTAGALVAVLQPLPLRLALAGVFLAMIVADADRVGPITELTAQQLEWQFLRDQVPRLPPAKRLLAFSDSSLDLFPMMLFPAQITPEIISQEAAVAANRWPRPGGDLLYYQSMACWFRLSTQPPVPVGMHPQCAAVREHYVMEPVAVTALASRVGPMVLATQPPPYPIGFYRLTGER